MTLINTLIFDFAGVIASDGYWLWFEKNVPDLDRHRNALMELSILADSATISETEFLRRISHQVGFPPDEIRNGILAHIVINKKIVKLIRSARQKNYKIGLLTNFIAQWLRPILEVNRLNTLFDAIMISSEHRLVKPQREAFEKILQMLAATPANTLFIDDRAVNVNTARNLGFDAIQFTAWTSLLGAFTNRNIHL
ncbi:MAG TPA: hypothetical protein ENN20_05525 [Candidatus Marinimicrobia bacterium]|nr:hypothetical protein [Candidatus Neomarinimicrobiota bacterium]